MRWPTALLIVTAAVSVAVGATRWRTRRLVEAAYRHAESAEGWTLHLPSGESLATWTSAQGEVERLRAFDGGMPLAGYDLREDRERLATIESDGGPTELRVYDRGGRRIAEWTRDATCPRFEPGGALLFSETEASTGETRLWRIGDPDDRNRTPVVVPLPEPVGAQHLSGCFQVAEDYLAWIGTDLAVHVARAEGGGYTADHRVFMLPGSRFQLARGGPSLILLDPTGVVRFDLANAAMVRLHVAPRPSDLLATSPDGRWLLVSVGAAHWIVRLSDGASFPVAYGRLRSFYLTPQAPPRWIAVSPDERRAP